ncbi:MAG: PASTA domain-containing protein [Taibaiella sp.]|nr:PASTA domain-containing protein [Taibaiella sp.]
MENRTRRSFLFNLLIVLLLFVTLYILFFISLRFITRHDSATKVPNVTGLTMKTAMAQMEAMDFDVYVDSSYEPKQKAFTVLKQLPDAGSVVKRGRTVFLTVNKSSPPLTAMPNLISLSYRSAEMILKNNKLVPGDTTYKPDIANGAVLSQLFNGQEIRPGQMLPQGSRINMVLGDGLGNTQYNVPDVIGMAFDEGVAALSGTGLQYTALWDSDISDSSTAIIYDETPKPINPLGAANRIKEGDIVDIRIKQNPSTEEMESNRKGRSGVNNANTNDVTNDPAATP